jgi:hypothetical protein
VPVTEIAKAVGLLLRVPIYLNFGHRRVLSLIGLWTESRIALFRELQASLDVSIRPEDSCPY